MKKIYTALVLTLFVLPLVAQNIPSYVPKDGLVGYWPFNGNANDESGNGNHGTVNGATLTADRNGVANSAYSFDGDNDFITITNSLIKGGYQSYTISYWFNKLAPTSSTQAVINDRNSMISGYKYYSNFVDYINGSGVQACSANQDITSTSCVSSKSNNQSNGNWNNVIITLNTQSNIAKIYLNGVEEGSKLFNPSSWPISTNSTYLGGSPLAYGDEQWLDGKLDDVTFYNRALSDQEITALYTGTPIAQNIPSYLPKDGLVGYWPFNGNANDESGNGNHGTVNGAKLTTDRNGDIYRAYSFDGINNYIEIPPSSSLDTRYSISIFAWVNSKGSSGPIVNYCKNGCGVHLWETQNYSASELFERITKRDHSFTEPLQIDGVLTEGWKFVGVTYDNASGLVKLWLNGELVKSNNIGNLEIATQDEIRIGLIESDNRIYTGNIDDISIYNRALSDQEVKQLYAGCSKETATSSNFNSVIYTTTAALNLNANPSGGTFSGDAVTNNAFNPSKAKLGKNQVKYNFKNTTGCADSTDFAMLVVDTVGATCTKYDTVTIKNNVFDTVKVNKTIYDTVSILKIKFKLTTGISANQLSSLNIYPNPTSDVLHIEIPDAKALEGYRYRIVDALGKEVYNQLVTQSATEIPLKTLGAAGIYQFEILDAKNVSIQSNKIVLQ